MTNLNFKLRSVVTIFACLAMCMMFSGCGGSGGGGSKGGGSYKIKITTESGGDIGFLLSGSGVATVDWGDGSEKVTLTLNEVEYDGHGIVGVRFSHNFPNASLRTITINGDNITGLICGGAGGNIESLDVSRCTELKRLVCQGSFSSLDLSKNTALTHLYCGSEFTSSALNALFETLNNNPGEKKICIREDVDCDKSIATNKGWKFDCKSEYY